MTERLKNRDTYELVTVNALQPVGKRAITSTLMEISTSSKPWYGYSLNNNDAGARWIQVFFKRASQVTLGVTAPDKSILMPASGNVTLELENPILTSALTIAGTTTETGSTTITTGATGEFFFAKD